MITPEKRRPVPLAIALKVALRQLAIALGLAPETRFELDHYPALRRRLVDPKTRQHIPHQHDPAALQWLPKAAHAIKTNGTKATTLGSDKHEIAKTDRLEKQQAEVRARLLSKAPGSPPPKKNSIPGRGFRRPDREAQRSASRPLVRRGDTP